MFYVFPTGINFLYLITFKAESFEALDVIGGSGIQSASVGSLKTISVWSHISGAGEIIVFRGQLWREWHHHPISRSHCVLLVHRVVRNKW